MLAFAKQTSREYTPYDQSLSFHNAQMITGSIL